MIEDGILTVTASFGKSLYQSNEFGWKRNVWKSGPTRECPKTLRNAESLNRPGLATSRTSRPQIIEFTAGKPPFSKV